MRMQDLVVQIRYAENMFGVHCARTSGELNYICWYWYTDELRHWKNNVVVGS